MGYVYRNKPTITISRPLFPIFLWKDGEVGRRTTTGNQELIVPHRHRSHHASFFASMISFLIPLFVSSHCLETVEELLRHRSKRPPTENETHPLDVKLGMYLESLGNFRSSEMSFDADIYVYMSWRDVRLAHNFSDYVLINDDAMRNQIWLPDLYFANARQAHFQDVTVPNFNMFIAPDGTVAYSLRCTLTVACNLDLRFYPMDSQMCSIRVLSYAYIATQVNVTWFDSNPIRSNPDIGLPEFVITAVTKSYCNGTYRYALMPNSYKLDDFSCLEGNLFLSRSIGYNLVQSYIPTGLIVMISWVSFWIDRRAVPARVTLSFTTLVSLTTLGNGLRFGLPQVSYAKAIDLWYGACMLFVFSALLEFAIINSYMRKSEKFDSMGKKIYSNIAIAKKVVVPSISSKPLDCKSLNGFQENERSRTATKPGMKFIDEVITPSSKRTRRLSNVKSLGIPLLKRASTGENIRFVDTKFHKGEINSRAMESSALSIYDNVTPWRNLDKALLEDEDSGSEDETSWRPCPSGKAHLKHHGEDNVKKSSAVDADSAGLYSKMSKDYSRQALRIDKQCRYGFPLTFLAWNLWYWWYYLVFQKVDYFHLTGV